MNKFPREIEFFMRTNNNIQSNSTKTVEIKTNIMLSCDFNMEKTAEVVEHIKDNIIAQIYLAELNVHSYSDIQLTDMYTVPVTDATHLSYSCYVTFWNEPDTRTPEERKEYHNLVKKILGNLSSEAYFA